MYALPAIAQSDETAKRFHVFPQVVDGGGWQSFLLVTNVAQSSSFCTFELHGLSLDRFPGASGITASGSTATFSLDGSGGYLAWPTKNELAFASGYATLDCTAPTVAQVLYASSDGSGVTGMATVFSSQAGGVFQFPVLTADASLGIAIANDTNTEASCSFVLESRERENHGEAKLQVSSKSNVARFLYEVIPTPGGFTGGSATVSCDQQVSVIGLQFAGAIFTTLPPAILSTTSVSPTQPAKSFNQQQTERLIGTWEFTYTVSSADFKNTYRLSDVQESSSTPGEWVILGTDEYSVSAIAGYTPRLEEFLLLGSLGDIEQVFTFDFVGSSTVSVDGCYYHDGDYSECFLMTGVRTSLSTSALSRATSALPSTTAAHAELREIGEAEKLENKAQIEVDPRIIRALEDLREVLRQ